MNKTYWAFMLFLSFLVTAIPTLANETTNKSIDKDALVKIQDQYLFQTVQLKELQAKVLSPKPLEWEFSTLQAVIQESNCLERKPQYTNASELTSQEFATLLDKCFQGLENIANAKDPDRFIRKNIDNLRELRDRSSLYLDKLESKYTPFNVLSANGLVRILLGSVDKSEVSIENIQALRHLINKYKNILYFEGLACYSQVCNDKPFTRIEIARILHQTLDKFQELLATGLADKIDDSDFSIMTQLQEEFAVERSSFSGLRALEARVSPNLHDYLDIKNDSYMEYISR